jgi:hypothetical protein
MEYQPAALTHTDIFENFIDTQKAQGHTSEGGPLPAYLLTRQFEETPGTYDPYAYYDYSRRTLADCRADAPLFECETPWDTRKWSKTRMNVRTTGTRSGADPAAHPEIFLGFMDEDTRTPGDDHFPAWRIAQQMAARAHYLKPVEPEGASHLGENVADGVEPENQVYKKLNVARARVKRNLRMFGRSIENDQPRAGRDWQPLPCAVNDQIADGGAGSAEKPATTMRHQMRAEYNPGDEKRGRQRPARVMKSSDAASLRAARACAMAPGGGASEVIERESVARAAAPARRDASARADKTARTLRHSARGPSEHVAEAESSVQAVRNGTSVWHLARNMANVARRTSSDMAADDTPGPGVMAPMRWHLDTGDPLALLHRATGHEAARQQEILHIATEIARRTTLSPWSAPHLGIRADGSLGRALEWGGGPERAMIDDQTPSYLIVDALLMKRACERPRETALIRRKMLTDARKPTGTEIELANQTMNLLNGYKGAVIANSRTHRDMEMASDALLEYNLRQQSIGESPASWHHAQRVHTETQLTAEPVHCLRGPARSAPREAPVAANIVRAAMRATRCDAQRMDGVRHPRCGDMSDRIAPVGERERGIGSMRLGRVGPSRCGQMEMGMTPALNI